MATTKMQEIGDDDDDVNKRRVNSKNYSIRLSARGGVCAKFTVVYGQSRVVCVEWLPIYIIYTKLGVAVPVRAREQGRFRGSTKGSKGTTEGARGNTKGAPREVLRGGTGAQQMAA